MQETEIKEVNKVVYLSNNDILPNRFQPRKYFDEEEIMQLSESIKEHGVINPVIVRKLGDKYELVAGERRYKANILAGNDDIPAIIMDVNDKESSEIAVVENIQRKDLNAIEEAISYKRILDIGYMTQDQLAQKMGKSQSAIANKIRLLKLSDEVQDALMKKQISERHARSLLKLESQKKQNELLERIINERLTVRKTDEEIEKMNNNTNSFNNIYNNTPETITPIMPGSNVSDVNISGVQPTYQSQNNSIAEQPVQKPIANAQIEHTEQNPSFNMKMNPEITLDPISRDSQNTFENTQVEEIPTMSIDDVLAKANQPSVVGNQEVNQPILQDNTMDNNYGIPNINPINENPTPIVQSQNNNEIFEMSNLNSTNENAINQFDFNLPDLNDINQKTIGEQQSSVIEPQNFAIPNLNPISENPAPVDEFLNSINESTSKQESLDNKTNEINKSLDNFTSFNLNKEDSNENTTISTAPIIDTSESINSNNYNMENNILKNDFNVEPQTQFEKVPEPIIVNDYNDQYDPIMPKNQNQQPTIDFKTIINLIRKCSQAIENSGYKIETEEYNLDNMYQVVFKIDKQ